MVKIVRFSYLKDQIYSNKDEIIKDNPELKNDILDLENEIFLDHNLQLYRYIKFKNVVFENEHYISNNFIVLKKLHFKLEPASNKLTNSYDGIIYTLYVLLIIIIIIFSFYYYYSPENKIDINYYGIFT
jgi:hypothetical protein